MDLTVKTKKRIVPATWINRQLEVPALHTAFSILSIPIQWTMVTPEGNRNLRRALLEMEELPLPDGLKPILNVEALFGGEWVQADILWHEKQFWLVSDQRCSLLNHQVPVAIQGEKISFKSLRDRLRRRCKEYDDLLIAERRHKKVLIARRKQEAKDREIARKEATERYQARLALHVGSTELLSSGNGWTKHYIKKLLGTPDWIQEESIGYGSYRKDITRHMWLRSKVTSAIPRLQEALSKKTKERLPS
jgi:hypothetical protein